LRRYWRLRTFDAEAADGAGWDADAVTEASERRNRVTRDPLVVDHAERLAGLGSWEWVPAAGELVWSDNLFRLYGLEIAAIFPSPEYVVGRVHPDDLGQVMATLEALTAGEPRSVEYRFRRDDGEVMLLRATVAVVCESDAGDLRIIGLVQDLTAQRRLEREVAARVAVTEALEGWRTLEDSAAELLAGLARVMGFVFGALPPATGRCRRHLTTPPVTPWLVTLT